MNEAYQQDVEINQLVQSSFGPSIKIIRFSEMPDIEHDNYREILHWDDVLS